MLPAQRASSSPGFALRSVAGAPLDPLHVQLILEIRIGKRPLDQIDEALGFGDRLTVSRDDALAPRRPYGLGHLPSIHRTKFGASRTTASTFLHTRHARIDPAVADPVLFAWARVPRRFEGITLGPQRWKRLRLKARNESRSDEPQSQFFHDPASPFVTRFSLLPVYRHTRAGIQAAPRIRGLCRGWRPAGAGNRNERPEAFAVWGRYQLP